MTAVAGFRWQEEREPIEMMKGCRNTRKFVPQPKQYLRAALDYLPEDAQKNIAPDTWTGCRENREKKVPNPAQKISVVAGREKSMRKAYEELLHCFPTFIPYPCSTWKSLHCIKSELYLAK